MAHECPDCGEGCHCDQEDVFHEYGPDVDNCVHRCRESDEDDHDPQDDFEDDRYAERAPSEP